MTVANSAASVTGSGGNLTTSSVPDPGSDPAASPDTSTAGRAPGPAAVASTLRVKPSGSIATVRFG